MKSEGNIRHKLKQVAFRHRKKFVAEGLAILPSNCKWNRPLSTPEGENIRACTFKQGTEDWNAKVCDEAFQGVEQAETCPYFECCNTPEELKSQFNRMIGLEGGPKPLSQLSTQGYSDLTALLWVLEGDVEPNPEGDADVS